MKKNIFIFILLMCFCVLLTSCIKNDATPKIKSRSSKVQQLKQQYESQNNQIQNNKLKQKYSYEDNQLKIDLK